MIILNEFNEACLKFEILTVFSFDKLINLLCKSIYDPLNNCEYFKFEKL